MVVEDDFPDSRSRRQAAQLARLYQAKIITNDYNLNKVAQIERARAQYQRSRQALKPPAPDEHGSQIIKEGKEAFQASVSRRRTMVSSTRARPRRTQRAESSQGLADRCGRMIFGKMSGVVVKQRC